MIIILIIFWYHKIMQNIYQTFEFNKIQEEIYPYLKSERARDYLSSLTMASSYEELSNLLLDLEEIMTLIRKYGDLPLSPSYDALRLIDEAKKSGILTAQDIYMIGEDIKTSIALYAFIKKIELLFPRIKDKILRFKDLTNLKKEIDRVISPSLFIKDEASPELSRIRKDIRKSELLLEKKITTIALSYKEYLNDDNATLRDGHLVLPVKTAYKNKVPGLIYDVSDSGNTTFIEPLDLVQLNNEITHLKIQENEEIRRILKALTGLILLQEEEIIINNDIIAELDFLSGKAKYSLSIDGVIASINKNSIISLKKARHPLIDQRKVVANDYYADEEKRIIIISGPNAGGKTVSLKTIGLCVLLNQCGIAVPAMKAELGVFKHIYIDIGDNQSLSDNLSTFSAHMYQIGEIINSVGGKDLVLLDELGTGTDPKEGEALAYALTRYLEGKKCLAFISSHFEALKEYAFLSKNLDNSSMLFDEDNLKPTYVFKQGAPGKSYALSVASRYGIEEKIVEDARNYLTSKGQSESDELTSVLLKKINENSKLEKALEEKSKILESERKRLEVDNANLNKKRDNLLKDVNEEKERLINKTKKELDSIIKMLSNGDLKLHEVIELKKRIEELEENTEMDVFDEEIKVGDYVSIPALNMNGRVTSFKGKKAKINSDSGFSFEVEVNKLHKILDPENKNVKPKPSKNYEDILRFDVPLELNIIGLRVDEARMKLEKYIDDVRLKNFHQVRIIHGFGSGALRKMTHEYLNKQKDLTYRLGDAYEGGAGATVVIFK